jgi:hypothetical protein
MRLTLQWKKNAQSILETPVGKYKTNNNNIQAAKTLIVLKKSVGKNLGP